MPQVAFAIARNVGHAVARNRVRRRLREILRAHGDLLDPATIYLFHAYPGAAEATYHELEQQVTSLLIATKEDDV